MYGLDIHKMSENWLKKCGIFLWNLFPYYMKKLTKPFQKLFSKEKSQKISNLIKPKLHTRRVKKTFNFTAEHFCYGQKDKKLIYI